MPVDLSRFDSEFLDALRADGFVPVGRFSVNSDPRLRCTFEHENAAEWLQSIYCFASAYDRGTVLRIGKSQSRLGRRIRSYEYYVNAFLSGELAPNEKWKGGTPPWEGKGWLQLTEGGLDELILAQQVRTSADNSDGLNRLRQRECALIRRYNPPLCNDSAAGRMRRQEWISDNGRPIVRRRSAVAAPPPSRVDEGATISKPAPAAPSFD